MLSITASLNLRYEQNFSLNLINPVELYAFAHETKNRRRDVISLNQPPVCQQKWLRMGFEPMPAPTRPWSHETNPYFLF